MKKFRIDYFLGAYFPDCDVLLNREYVEFPDIDTAKEYAMNGMTNGNGYPVVNSVR